AKQRAADRAQASARRAATAARVEAPAAESVSSPAVSSGGNGFISPVSGPLTSPYGMRLHPVLHYWKLHDGMDFGAGCGAPIRAPQSGVVTEAHYNAGYGNRLLIDHGSVGGSYVTTAYNHATHYVVGVGEHVSQGEVIGYVGTTGYSTGCHLHLMVWRNGQMVNPATIF
ncbi:MAG: M23 family metallopeptidase, partial [Luteococcus japonicus]